MAKREKERKSSKVSNSTFSGLQWENCGLDPSLQPLLSPHRRRTWCLDLSTHHRVRQGPPSTDSLSWVFLISRILGGNQACKFWYPVQILLQRNFAKKFLFNCPLSLGANSIMMSFISNCITGTDRLEQSPQAPWKIAKDWKEWLRFWIWGRGRFSTNNKQYDQTSPEQISCFLVLDWFDLGRYGHHKKKNNSFNKRSSRLWVISCNTAVLAWNE